MKKILALLALGILTGCGSAINPKDIDDAKKAYPDAQIYIDTWNETVIIVKTDEVVRVSPDFLTGFRQANMPQRDKNAREQLLKVQ
jgi:hypothetical protein